MKKLSNDRIKRGYEEGEESFTWMNSFSKRSDLLDEATCKFDSESSSYHMMQIRCQNRLVLYKVPNRHLCVYCKILNAKITHEAIAQEIFWYY